MLPTQKVLPQLRAIVQTMTTNQGLRQYFLGLDMRTLVTQLVEEIERRIVYVIGVPSSDIDSLLTEDDRQVVGIVACRCNPKTNQIDTFMSGFGNDLLRAELMEMLRSTTAYQEVIADVDQVDPSSVFYPEGAMASVWLTIDQGAADSIIVIQQDLSPIQGVSLVQHALEHLREQSTLDKMTAPETIH